MSFVFPVEKHLQTVDKYTNRILSQACGKVSPLYVHARSPHDTITALYSRERHLSGLLSLAMVVAIAISCMGLLGLASFAAQQRRKEMSIRKILGAGTGRIIGLLTGAFLWPVGLAFVIAAPVAWYFMHNWLQGFVYRTAVPWWLFVACGATAVAIALLTVGWQAFRTATTNPADNLKVE